MHSVPNDNYRNLLGKVFSELLPSKHPSNMANQSSRHWIAVTATVALAVVLLITAFLILPSPGKITTTTGVTTTTSTSPQTTTATLSASDYNSSIGLRLTLTISNSRVSRNDGMSMRISLNNTFATQNDLSPPPQNGSSAIWLSSWNLEPCTTFPIGVEIFKGNYASGNLSQGDPLGLVVPTGYSCADHPRSEISFAPLSGNITSPTGSLINQSNVSVGYWGYWTGSVMPPSHSAAFRSFEPGTYTIEGEDWWGQVTLLHFQVVVNENPLTCATIASNSSFVGYTNGSAGEGPLKLEAYYHDPRINNTVVLALSNTGNSTLAVLSYNTGSFYFGYTPYQFSPNGSQVQRWQYYAPNGTLSYPAFFYPNECVLISMTLSSPFPQVPLSLGFTDNQTQTFTFNP